MRDTEFLAQLLRVEPPWKVVESQLDLKRQRVDARLEWDSPALCPACGRECPIHDHRERTWRDLDLAGDQFFLHASVPRVDCPEHGVKTVPVPWSTGRTEFTERFERLAIALLLEMSVSGVSRRLGISWDQVDAIMNRAVKRGRERRQPRIVAHLGVDEKAVKRRYRYFTIVSDLDRGEVIWIGRGRKRESLDPFWASLSAEQLEGIEGIAMDMWLPYFESALAHVPGARGKIIFDRFHITSYLTKAVDLTRRALMRDASLDRENLKGSKYDWLRNVAAMSRAQRAELSDLRSQYHKLGRAWAIKEAFAQFWDYRREVIARKFFAGWYRWATHSRIPAVIDVAKNNQASL